MRLVTFNKGGTPTAGVRLGDEIVDLSVAAPSLPQSVAGLLAGGRSALDAAATAANSAGDRLSADEIDWLPPIPNPGKIICLGLNYRDHAIETNNPIPDYPVVFTRQATTLAAHGKNMVRPRVSEQLDFEAELAFIIGTGGRHISRADALNHIGGYACFNDGSVRDYQMKTGQFTMGKNFDATGGFGPDLVTPDELPDGASGLQIQCRLNGETVQNSKTDQLIFDVAETIALLTEVMTLNPGDVVITGTPSGVGAARTPKLWMKGGDTVEVEIEGIGTLRNPVVNES